MSKSNKHTLHPFFARAAAALHANVVFPVPPFYEWKAIHLVNCLWDLSQLDI